MSHQIRNPAAEAAMAGYMRRSDPAFGWSMAISSYQYLNGLRGFWPLSSRDESGNAIDLSGQGRTLTNVNAVPFGHPTDKVSIQASFNSASSHALTRTDEVATSITGALTFGCWLYFASVPASTAGLISKYVTVGNQRSYRLFKNSTNKIIVAVSGTGSSDVEVTSTRTVAANTWYFFVGRYVPSTSLTIWMGSAAGGLESDVNTTSIPASIFDSNSALELGVTNGNYLNGSMCLPFLCASALEDYIIWLLYHRTRSMFGL